MVSAVIKPVCMITLIFFSRQTEEDLVINLKDFPSAKLGDIVEIYHPEHDDEHPRLLLQIKTFRDDLQTKGKLF